MSSPLWLASAGLSVHAPLQGVDPPPTSGNWMTIFLGLTAFSLVAVVVGAAIWRSLRSLWAARRPRDALHGIRSTGASERVEGSASRQPGGFR